MPRGDTGLEQRTVTRLRPHLVPAEEGQELALGSQARHSVLGLRKRDDCERHCEGQIDDVDLQWQPWDKGQSHGSVAEEGQRQWEGGDPPSLLGHGPGA